MLSKLRFGYYYIEIWLIESAGNVPSISHKFGITFSLLVCRSFIRSFLLQPFNFDRPQHFIVYYSSSFNTSDSTANQLSHIELGVLSLSYAFAADSHKAQQKVRKPEAGMQAFTLRSLYCLTDSTNKCRGVLALPIYLQIHPFEYAMSAKLQKFGGVQPCDMIPCRAMWLKTVFVGM